MKLLVQKYLENSSFEDLEKEHGVYASFSKSGQYFSLNYDMIESKEDDLLAQECRGLILSSIDGKNLYCSLDVNGKRHYVSPGKTRILCYGMRRFFNYGQGSCAKIDWNDPCLKVLEKLDGTLCQVWYNPFSEVWNVSTRSVPDADLLMDNNLFTFRTLFEKALRDTCGYCFEDFTDELNQDYTYCFELTTPYNRIVVNYPDNRITLLAIRNLISLHEMDPNTFTSIPKIHVVQAHTYTTIDDLIDWVSSLNPIDHEGVVVRDAGFNRIKVKNAQYVALSKVRDRLATSERNIVELILGGKDDDVISFLPEDIVTNLHKIKAGVQLVIKQYDEQYQAALVAANHILPNDKKTFAILVTKNKQLWSAPFFSMFEKKSDNMKDFIIKARKNGSWGDGFLDRILDLAKAANVQ